MHLVLRFVLIATPNHNVPFKCRCPIMISNKIMLVCLIQIIWKWYFINRDCDGIFWNTNTFESVWEDQKYFFYFQPYGCHPLMVPHNCSYVIVLNITLFSWYLPFHSNNINDNVSPKFIKMNLQVRINKHGIVPNCSCLIPSPTQPTVIVG